jgi:putative aldouronate transport system substrate-binding protein
MKEKPQKAGTKTRSRLGFIVCAVLILLIFAGCFGKGGSADSGTQTVVYYLISFNRIPDSYGQVKDAINTYIAGKYPDAKVKLDFQLFSIAEYDEKIRLAMQSGTQIDLFTPLNIQNYIAQGQCRAIENLLQTYGKELTAMVRQDIGDDAFRVFEQNGHTWAVPVNKGMVITPTLIYNKDMLAAAGYSIDDIRTFRDLEPVFDKIKKLYPDVFPYAPTNARDTYLFGLMEAEKEIDALNDRSTYMGVIFGSSGRVVNVYETPEFAEYVNIMRSWYNKGYMPKDIAVSNSRAQEYFNANRAFCTMAGYGGDSIGVTMSSMTGQNMGHKWIAPFYFSSTSASLSTVISSTSKIPEAAMKMLNIIYTDEFVINTILYGIEGKDYVKMDEHHWAYPSGQNENTVSYTASLTTGVCGSERIQFQPAGVDYDDVMLKLRQNREAKRSPYFGFMFDASTVTNELTALSNVYSQYVPNILCGSADPATAIPELNRALKAAGIETVIAEKQKQLDAWIAAGK